MTCHIFSILWLWAKSQWPFQYSIYFWLAIRAFHNLSVNGIWVEEPANQNMEYRKGQSSPWYDHKALATFCKSFGPDLRSAWFPQWGAGKSQTLLFSKRTLGLQRVKKNNFLWYYFFKLYFFQLKLKKARSTSGAE